MDAHKVERVAHYAASGVCRMMRISELVIIYYQAERRCAASVGVSIMLIALVYI